MNFLRRLMGGARGLLSGRLASDATRAKVRVSDSAGRGRGRRGPSAAPVELARADRRTLEAVLRRARTSQVLAKRVRVVIALDADPDSCVSAVAESWADGDRKYVRMWRDRYLEQGLDGLKTRQRPGRPHRIGAVGRCQVLAMACGKPADFGVAHRSRWTIDSLQQAYMKMQQEDAILDPMSRTSVLRILNKAEIRPHRVKMWLHSPDPLFREKVTELCELYRG